MVEVSKPDYLSLVNQGGSGYNIKELVSAIVTSQIEPSRILQTSKLEKTENAISGFGYLNAQAANTQTNFDRISENPFFEVTQDDVSGVDFSVTDENLLEPSIRTISEVATAKKMIFELGGFVSATDTLEAAGVTIDIDFGTWTENNADNFSFVEAPDNSTQQITFADKSLSQIALLFNDVTGIEAQVVDTTGEGDNYSLILYSDDTGAETGFKLQAAGNTRWETTSIPSSTIDDNKFTQVAADANFKLDGIEFTRTSNIVSDLIPGMDIELRSDFDSEATVIVSRSEAAIKQSAYDIIMSLNEFKAELDRLTFVDVDGDENGPLAMDPSATILKSNFKKLSMEPILGYGADSVYLAQLGIKVGNQGQFYLDENTFRKTFNATPELFSALKADTIFSDVQSTTVRRSEYTDIDPGEYSVSFDVLTGDWLIGDTILTRTDTDGGGSSFTSASYPGLYIETIEQTPADFKVYIGDSFSSKMKDFMSQVLDMNSSVKSAEDSYKDLTISIQSNLDKLVEREKLLSTRYTEQFGNMEQAMTQFNSTKTLLENYVNSWKDKS